MLYSARNNSPSRSSEELTESFVTAAWSEFDRLVNTHAFAKYFPKECFDGNQVVGTDYSALMGRLRGEIRGIAFEGKDLGRLTREFGADLAQLTSFVWDIIEFSLKYVSTVSEGDYHSYYKHSHLTFDPDDGQSQYREFVESLLCTHGLAFKMNEDGQVVRLVPESTVRTLKSVDGLASIDVELGDLLAASEKLFLSRDAGDNKQALKLVWDAFERVKSLAATKKAEKKASIQTLIQRMANGGDLHDFLVNECEALTSIGNMFNIRHSEMYQADLTSNAQARYLFLRMLSFIYLASASLGVGTPVHNSVGDFGDIPF